MMLDVDSRHRYTNENEITIESDRFATVASQLHVWLEIRDFQGHTIV